MIENSKFGWFGALLVTNKMTGEISRYLWDYENGKARLESEMTKEDIIASDKKRCNMMRETLIKNT